MGRECFEQGIRHLFECGLCDFICRESLAFHVHIQERHRCKFLPCKKCKKLYNLSRPLISHIETWHYQFVYRCGSENCTFEACNRKAFQLHLTASHKPEFPCKYCKENFSTIQDLLTHWRVLKACDEKDCRSKKEHAGAKKADTKFKTVPKVPNKVLKFVSIQPAPCEKLHENGAVTSKSLQTYSISPQMFSKSPQTYSKLVPTAVKKSVNSTSSLNLPSVQSKLCVVNGSVSHLTFPITSVANNNLLPGHTNKSVTAIKDLPIKITAPVSCQPIKIVKTKMVQKSQSRHADDSASFFVFTESKTSPTRAPISNTTNVSENSLFLKAKHEDMPVNASDESTLPQVSAVKSEAIFDCSNDLNPELPVSDDYEMSIERAGKTDFKVVSITSKSGNRSSYSQVEHSMKTLFSLADIEQLAESKSDVCSVNAELDISNVKVEPEDESDVVKTIIKSEPIENDSKEGLITDGEIENSCSTFPLIAEDITVSEESLFEVCESAEVKNEICSDFQRIKEEALDDLALENTSKIFSDQCKKICLNSDVRIIDHDESLLKRLNSSEFQDVAGIECDKVSHFDSPDFLPVVEKAGNFSKSLISAVSTDPLLRENDVKKTSDFVKERNHSMPTLETDSDSSNDSADRLVIDEDNQEDGGREHQALIQTVKYDNVSDAGVLDLGAIFKRSDNEKDVKVSVSSDRVCLPEIENDDAYSSDTEIDATDTYSVSSMDEDSRMEFPNVTGTSVTKANHSEVPSITAFSSSGNVVQEKIVNISIPEKGSHQELNVAAPVSSLKEDDEIEHTEETKLLSFKVSESIEIPRTAQSPVAKRESEAEISNVSTSVHNFESILKKLVVKVVPLRLSKDVVKVVPLCMPKESIQQKAAVNVSNNPQSIFKGSILKMDKFVANNSLCTSSESIQGRGCITVANKPLSVSEENVKAKGRCNFADNPQCICREGILKMKKLIVANNAHSVSSKSIQGKGNVNVANIPQSVSEGGILKMNKFIIANNPPSTSKEGILQMKKIIVGNNPLFTSSESSQGKGSVSVTDNALSISNDNITMKEKFSLADNPHSVSKEGIIKMKKLIFANPVSVSSENVQEKGSTNVADNPQSLSKNIVQMKKFTVANNPLSISSESIQEKGSSNVTNEPLSTSKQSVQKKVTFNAANNLYPNKKSFRYKIPIPIEHNCEFSKIQKKVTFNVANNLDPSKKSFCDKIPIPVEHNCGFSPQNRELTVRQLLKKYKPESDFPVKRKSRSKPETLSVVRQADQSVKRIDRQNLSLLKTNASETSPNTCNISSSSVSCEKEAEFASCSSAAKPSHLNELLSSMAETSSFQTIPVVVTASSKQPLVSVLSTSLPRMTASCSKLPNAVSTTKSSPLVATVNSGLNSVASSVSSAMKLTDSGSGAIDVSSCKVHPVTSAADSIMPLQVHSKPDDVASTESISPAVTVSNSVTVASSVSSPIIVTLVNPKKSHVKVTDSRSLAVAATNSSIPSVSPVTISSSTVSVVSMTNTVSSVLAANRSTVPIVWVPKDKTLPAVVFNIPLPSTSTNSTSLTSITRPSTKTGFGKPKKKIDTEVKKKPLVSCSINSSRESVKKPLVACSINSSQESVSILKKKLKCVQNERTESILSSKGENVQCLKNKTNVETVKPASDIFVASKNQAACIDNAVQVPVSSESTKFTIRTSYINSAPFSYSSSVESSVDLHPSLKLLLTGTQGVDNSNIMPNPTQGDMASGCEASFHSEDEECTQGVFKKPAISSNFQYLKYLKQLKYSITLKEMAQTSNYFKCMLPACSFTSNSPSEFIEHSKLHSVQSVQCTYCLKCVSNAEALVNHAVRCHRRRIFQCSLCFYRACSKVHVAAHIQACHHKKQCSVLTGTPIKMDSVKLPEEEIKFRIDIRQMNCSFESCLYVTNSITDMAYHLSQHTSNALFTCFLCHFKCLSAFDWFLHLKVHNIFLLHCLFCSFGCNKRLQMLNHLTACHADYPLLTYVRTSKHLYFILECFLYSDKSIEFKYIQDCSSPSNCYCYLFSCQEFEGDGNRILKLLENVKTKKLHFKLLECLYCVHRTGFIARMEKHLKQEHCIKTQLQYYHCISHPLSHSDIRNLFDNQNSGQINDKPVCPIGEEYFFTYLNALQASIMERHFASSKIQFKSCDSFTELQVYLPGFISRKQSNLANRILRSFYNRVFSRKLKRLNFSCAYCQRRSKTLSGLRLHWKNTHVLTGRKFSYSVNRGLLKSSANNCRPVTDHVETGTSSSSSCSTLFDGLCTANPLDITSGLKIKNEASDTESPFTSFSAKSEPIDIETPLASFPIKSEPSDNENSLSFEDSIKPNSQRLSVKRMSENSSSPGDKRIFKKRKSLQPLDSVMSDDVCNSDCSSKCPYVCLCNKVATVNNEMFSNFCRGPTNSKVSRTKEKQYRTGLKMVIFIENFLSHVKIPVSYLRSVLNMDSSVTLYNAKHAMLNSLKEYYKSSQT